MIFKNFTIEHVFQILICAILLFSQMVYSAETNQGIAKSIKNVLVEDRIQLIQSSVLKDETKNIKKDTEIFDSIKYTNPMVIPTDGDMMRVTSSRRTSL